jgi:hypothetical protein
VPVWVTDSRPVVEKPARALAKADPLRNAGQGEEKGGTQRFMRGNGEGKTLTSQVLCRADETENAVSCGPLGIDQHPIYRRMVFEQGSGLGSGEHGERRRREPVTEFSN